MSARALTIATLLLATITLGCRPAPPEELPVATWTQPEAFAQQGTLARFGRDAEARPLDVSGWATEAASDAPSPPSALCRGPRGESTYLLTAEPLANFDLRVWLRPQVAGAENLGVAFRSQAPDHHYLVRLNSRTNSVRLYSRAGEHWRLLDSHDRPLPVGRWRELTVRAEGPLIVVALGGTPLLQAEDATYASGRLALWIEEGSAGCFDDLWVAARPGGR